MADNTTELEVLDQIVDVLGGQSGQYETVVPVLQQIKELLSAGITDPEAIAAAVAAWLDEHPEATTVQDGSITARKLAQDVIELLDNKADIDGYYSQLTAGLAENLIGRGDAVPAEYLYRTAGGTADIEDGIATVSSIKGNTLVWNQIISGGSNDTVEYGDVTFTWTAERNELTVVVNSEVSTTRNYLSIPFGVSELVDGHKYLFPCYSRGNSSEPERYVYAGTTVYSGPIFTWSSGSETPHARARVLTTSSTGTWKYIYQLFDLTLMFGAGNEPSTVEEFEAIFPLPYYPYSAPKLLPVDIRGVETVGFNAYDPSTGEAELLGGHQYQISGTYTSLSYSTGESIALDSDGIFTPSDNGTLTVTGGNATDTCVHLVWSGYRDGEYEEYWKFQRFIPVSTYFPTGMRGVAWKSPNTGNVYSAYDYLYRDHADVVIGEIDLGDLTWETTSTTGVYAAGPTTAAGIPTFPYKPNTSTFLSDTYEFLGQSGYASGVTKNKAFCVHTGNSTTRRIYLRDDSYASLEALQAGMVGKKLQFQLATPTTTPIDPPLNLSYKVSDFGTERIMVDETADAPQTAPVPMEVEYGLNAIDTIRRLPTEYQSHKSMGQLTAALESSLGIDITETWDEDDQRYEYEVSDFELGNEAVTPNSLSDEVIHGQYPSLSVGRADALTGADSTAQWAQRTTEGSGSATVRSVQGAAVAWGQLIKPNNPRSVTSKGVTYTSTSDGKVTLDGTATGAESFTSSLALSVFNGHKYLYKGADTSRGVLAAVVGISGSINSESIYTATADVASTTLSVAFAATYTGTYECYPQLFDLTAMFGAGNEPTTVAEFESMFPAAYYPYSAPTLKPVQIAGIRSTGRNLINLKSPYGNGIYNAEVGYQIVSGNPTATPSGENPCAIDVPSAWNGVMFVSERLAVGNAYKFAFTVGGNGYKLSIYMLDANHVVVRRIGNYTSETQITSNITVQSNESYIALSVSSNVAGTVSLTNVMLQVATADFNTYKPYTSDAIEWTAQTLRAAGSVRDELTAGELVTRVGVVDLGTLDWDTLSSPETHVFRASLTSIAYLPATSDTSLPNAQIAGYTPKGWAPISSSDNKCFSLPNTAGDMRRVVIIDYDFSTTEAFSASVSGKPMFYALFNPTTTPINPALPMTYKVQQGGSEAIIVPEGEVSAAPVLTVAEGESAADVVMDALACIAAPDGPTATANHSVGTYLTMQGKLYKVTSAIAVGETITAGTNVTETTVMAELIALTQ